MAAKKRASDAVLRELRAFGLAYPEAHTKSPWPGHLDLAVRDKTFAYLSVEGEPFKVSCKLPHSNAVALMLPFTEPTPYGLGKSGWVSAKFAPTETPPTDLLKAWIDESYRAQAPKKLVAQLPPPGTAAPSKSPRSQATPRTSTQRKAPSARAASAKPPRARRPLKKKRAR